MKLKTTLAFALCGVLASAAGAFAIPTTPGVHGSATKDPWVTDTKPGGETEARDPARVIAGDTLAVDARLGHASLAKNTGTRETFLLAQIAATEDKSTGGAASSPMNLALVIDRSGSMKGDRIANAMNAAVSAIERLRDGDSVTVVAFDSAAQVVVSPTRVSAASRPTMEAAVRSIRLGGDTCISCGLQEAMQQLGAAASLSGDRVNRMILLSDGATNSGIKDVPGLRAMAGRMNAKGVTISTIGVDVDFDEKVMAALAAEGNGRHYFVANASGIPAVFAAEFDDILASVAKEAELSIELAPDVEVAEVFDRSFRREGSKIIVPFGAFSAKQEKTVLIKLRVPADREGMQAVADVKLAYRDLLKKSDGSAGGNLSLAIRSDGGEQRELDPFVAARVERSRTATTLTDANKLFEQGRVDEARAKLARRQVELKRIEDESLAFAKASPAKSAPARSAKSLDKDFEDQLGAVATADRNFAPAPSAAARPGSGRGQGFGGGGAAVASSPAPAPATVSPQSREGKASVRLNQQSASDFAF